MNLQTRTVVETEDKDLSMSVEGENAKIYIDDDFNLKELEELVNGINILINKLKTK